MVCLFFGKRVRLSLAPIILCYLFVRLASFSTRIARSGMLNLLTKSLMALWEGVSYIWLEKGQVACYDVFSNYTTNSYLR
ncbi:hypothetical protein F5Y04DRAFT_204844 [Hypomontagnella monticulosa]|nr:hypothetical protein F5Y04DRAFT_204844 [Hypomontagnella monticulosa]